MEEPAETDTAPVLPSEEINTVELPPCIEIKESLVHKGDVGAFAKVFISKDTRFGPYKGEIINPGQKEYIDYRYAWEVHEKRSRVLKFTISALDPKVSNWMRHVNNARFYEEQNILSVQDGFSIFYIAMKNIHEGQELLTWFDPKLLKRTQRRQTRTERRPIGYTIELVPWSDEKKFTPEIIETKRARKKKVLSDMISLDENPMAMTRTLQSLPKIPCTPRQLGNMAYPLANSIKKRKKEVSAKRPVVQRNMGDKRKVEQKPLQSKHVHISSEKFNDIPKPTSSIESKAGDMETKIKLESLPPHENLKEALQAAQEGPKFVPQVPQAVHKVLPVAPVPDHPDLAQGQAKRKRKRGRKKLSDFPGEGLLSQNGDAMVIKCSPGEIRPVNIQNSSDGSTRVEDHDESYLLRGVTLHPQCDDTCPCLDKAKSMRPADPPSAANKYAIRFTLLPEHKILRYGKMLYKCDICDGTYNHAFSLKRHYLSVHVNHRYLTREDILNCQIETFHTGIQIEDPKSQTMTALTPQSSVTVPAFMAVNVTNLLASLSPPKRVHDEAEVDRLKELGNRLHCDEELKEDTKISEVSKFPEKSKSVPSLSVLAQTCVNRLKSPSSDSCSDSVSKVERQISLDCNETLESDLLTPTKAERQGDLKSSLSNLSDKNVSYGIAGKTDDEIHRSNRQDEICDKVLSVDARKVNEESSKSMDSDNSSCKSLAGVGNDAGRSISSGTVPHIESSQMKICDYEKSLSKSVTSNCGDLDLELKNVKQEKENEIIKTEETNASLSEGECRNKKPEPASDAWCLSTEYPHINQEEDKDETDSCVAFMSDSKVLCGGTADSAVVLTPSNSDASNCSLLTSTDKNQESQNDRASSDSSTSDKDCSKVLLANNSPATDADKDTSHLPETITSISKSSLSSSSNSSSTVAKESSHSESQQPGNNSSTQGQTTRTSQPPLIFLTNIVIPVGAQSTLGQPGFPVQRPPTAALAQTVTTMVSTRAPLAAQCPTSLAQTAGPSTNLPVPGPRAPVPLVLISQVPPGVDPRNAASSFLKTSTGLKTLQDLQKSLTVAGLGNTNTQLSASNLPCLITPLTQGVAPASAPHGAISNTSTGGTPQFPKSTLPISISSQPPQMMANTVLSDTSASKPAVVISPSKPSMIPVVTSNISTLKSCSTFLSSNTLVTNSVFSTAPMPSLALPSSRPDFGTAKDHPEDLFRCHMCVLVFRSMEQLKQHIRKDPHRFKGGIKQYACQQCSMRFSNKHNLHRHNQMNHVEREDYNFRCLTCGKGFSSEAYLKMHARFHSGKSFPCKYGCKDVYFPNAATLVKHLRTEHAGLDLKEYKRIHKIRSTRRKKIKEILGETHAGSVLSPVGPQAIRPAPYNVVPVVGYNSESNCTVIGLSRTGFPGKTLQVSPYSIIQPGLGFQAKRGRPKGSKNTVKNGKPIIPSPINSPSPHFPPSLHTTPSVSLTEPLKVETSSGHLAQNPNRARRPRGIARFFCKLCPRKFSTHFRLLRHRTRKHGADQSVQEYLHFMSRDHSGYASEPDDSVYSPPASPKTFFSNVCQRGYENFTQFIDGGLESLKSPIKKYINIKGYTSMSAPFDHSKEQRIELEWTSYNFPPSFRYNYDSTRFYDSDNAENLKALTDRTLAQVKSENDRDSTPETDYAQTEDIKPSFEDPLTKEIKLEPNTEEDNRLSETAGNERDEEKDSVSDNPSSCEVISKTNNTKTDNVTNEGTSGYENKTGTSNISAGTTINNDTSMRDTSKETAASSINGKTDVSNVTAKTEKNSEANTEDVSNNGTNISKVNNEANKSNERNKTALGSKKDQSVSCSPSKVGEGRPQGIGSKERGKQLIENLARHLACEKLPDGESDNSDSTCQDDEGVECDGEDLGGGLDSKTEFLKGEHIHREEKKGVKATRKCEHFSRTVNNSQSVASVERKEKDKLQIQEAEMQNVLGDKITPSGTDSGLSSLSSCTLESPDVTQPNRSGNTDSHGKAVSSNSSKSAAKKGSGPETQLEDVKAEIVREKLPVKLEAKSHSEFPFINASDKKEMMKSLTIQGIVADDSIKAANKKLLVGSPARFRNLNALDLSVCGEQLSSDRLAKMMNSDLLRQEAGTKFGSKNMRHRSISLPSFREGDISLNSSDAGRHHEHRRLSLWGGHLQQKASDVDGHEAYHYSPITNILQKQKALREMEAYTKAKADRDKGVDKNHFPGNKLAFAESMGLMSRADFDMSPHARQQDVHVIKPPEVWANYENIWFGKRGPIVVVCSICHRHFSFWDLCLRHQLKKHPHIEPNFLQMEKGNYVDDMYYYYPMKFGILAQTEPIPSNLPLPELFVCTRCGFPFRNLNRLHAHVVTCDPALEKSAGYRSSRNRKKLIPMMDRRLSQQTPDWSMVKPKLGRPFKRPSQPSSSSSNVSVTADRPPAAQPAVLDADKTQPSSAGLDSKPVSLSPPFSFYHGRKRKNYELLYNPQNHLRRRESYQVLDTHQCHGCNLKFKSMSMLERHVKKCSGRDRLQSQKPLLSGIMPDDATLRKQHTCRYCNKRFTYIKGVDLHYKRICSVRKVREEEGQLTPEDLAHEEELRKIIEHLKWSKTLCKDSSDIIQGHVRVEADGSLTRVVKRRGCPTGPNRKVKKRKVKNKKWTYMKNHRHANRSVASSANSSQPTSPRSLVEYSVPDQEQHEKVNSSTQEKSNIQKKRSPPNRNLSPPTRKSLVSELSPSASDDSAKGSKNADPSATGKRGRPRKYPVGDPRSRTPRLTRSNSSTSKPTTEMKTPESAILSESPFTDADKESADRPQPRKRGRPKKFDPSEMESSYKKKRKSDLLLESSFFGKKDQKSRADPENSPMQTVEQTSSPAVTRRQQRSKVPTAAVREDFVYDNVSTLKGRPVSGKARARPSGAQDSKDEERLFSDIELMEKMKELKKAAQLESEKCKQRQEQRKAKAKNVNKSEDGEQITSGKTGKKCDTSPAASSTELFKHLTEDIPAVSKAKTSPPQKEHGKRVTTLPVKDTETTSGDAILRSKSASTSANQSPSLATVLTAEKPSANVSVLAPKTSHDAKLLSASVHLKPIEIQKDPKSKRIGTLSPKSKGAGLKKKESPRSDKDVPRNASNSEASAQSKTEKVEMNQKQINVTTMNKGLKSPGGKLSECTVKVVTLSPNLKNLVSHKTVSKDISETDKNQTKDKCEKTSKPYVIVRNSKSLDEDVSQETCGMSSPSVSLSSSTKKSNPVKKSDVKKNESSASDIAPIENETLDTETLEDCQTLESLKISTDVSFYSSGEDLFKVMDTCNSKSKVSVISARKTPHNGNVSKVKQNQETTDAKAAEREPSSELAADSQFCNTSTEEGEVQYVPIVSPGTQKKRTAKIVFVHKGKPQNIVGDVCINPGDLITQVQQPSGSSTQPGLAQQMVQISSSGPQRLPATVTTLDMSKSLGLTKESGVNSIPANKVVEDFSLLTGKPLATPIKLIRSGAPHKPTALAPTSGISQQKTVMVMPATTSGSTSAATPLKGGTMCLPMSQVLGEACQDMEVDQCETSILTTHIQIKDGMVTHKPRVVQKAVSARPVPIVSSLNPLSQIPASRGMIGPKVITTGVAQTAGVHPGTAVLVRPASGQTGRKTSAKVISPPIRVISHTGAAVRPRGTVPTKVCFQPDMSKLHFPGSLARPVQAAAGATPSTKLQTVKVSPAGVTASSSSISSIPARIGDNPSRPLVIRTLIPSKPAGSHSTQHPQSVRMPHPTTFPSMNNPAKPINSSGDHSNKQALDVRAASVLASPPLNLLSSSAQHAINIPQPRSTPASAISPAQQASRQLEPMHSLTAQSMAAQIPASPAVEEAESLFIQPPNNPIMITLEDGSTAMLDPESLAQLLSPVEEAAPEPRHSVMVSDPGSVMVNMSEIQPTQSSLHTGEILWEGFPDMLDGDINF